MESKIFRIHSSCSKTSARSGVIKTDHGEIQTPFFMPVGTHGAVKTQSSESIKNLPSSILLSNTYHLYLRPGIEILRKVGGLHQFMNWDGIILTDSGGYQIYSLSNSRKITDDGVIFRSHLDGSEHYFNPKSIIDIQRIIGSDFMMMLDECPPGDVSKKEWEKAVNRTTAWAQIGMDHYRNSEHLYNHKQVLIPIVQGGTDPDLRRQSAEQLIDLNADAYAIGGLAVGEAKDAMFSSIKIMDDCLPKDKPRYLMGVGTPADLVRSVSMGVDMFDCVMPTRNARNAQLFTFDGTINIRNSKYKNDFSPIDEDTCDFSKNYSKSYLHHLFNVREVLGLQIATSHNLHFYINLMNQMRLEIKNDTFEEWSLDFLTRYEKGN